MPRTVSQAPPLRRQQAAISEAVEEEQADVNSSEDDFALWTISGDHKEGYHVNLQINGKHIHMELDMGAAVSVISEQQWNQLFPNRPLESYTGSPLRGYSGQQLQVKGQKEVQVLYVGQSLKLPVVVMRATKDQLYWDVTG